MRHGTLGLFGVIFLAFGVMTSWAQAQPACDRDCLEGFVDRYLSALEANDPARLSLAEDVKFTENGQQLAVGEALWGTATSAGESRFVISDPETGQAAVFAVIEESGRPAILNARLKIEDGKITEIETIVIRDNARLFEAEAMKDFPDILSEPVPEDARVPREEMIAIANSYFTGLDTENSGKNVPFDPACRRRENGAVMANADDPEAGAMRNRTCQEQFDTGFSRIVTDIRERRFPVVDEERGIVYAIGFFDHNGTIKPFEMRNGEIFKPTPPYTRPFSWMIGEAFKIVDGRIRQIEAVLVGVPYGMPSGWSE